MKIKYLIASALLTLSLAGRANVNDCNHNIPNPTSIMITNDYDYAKAWQEVRKLDSDLKQREALAKVKEIRQNALKEKNYLQISRAFIYIIDYSTRLEESDEWKNELKLLRSTADDAPDAPKSFLYLLLGHMYNEYRDDLSYRFYGRTDVENDQNDDIETWSLPRINREIADCYRKAVANPKATQAVPLDDWKEAVQKENEGYSTLYCKTLYDFIALNTIKRYCDRNREQNDFSYKDIELVSDADKFINFQPKNNDTWSSENLRLSLYQELLRAHKNDKTPIAYEFINILRLNYYKMRSVNEDADDTYLKALEAIKSRYPNDPEITPAASYHIAQQYRNRGMLKEAHDLAMETLKKYPRSSANFGQASLSLAHDLEIKKLYLTGETAVAINTPFPMKLEYTNLEKIYLHIYKVYDIDDYNRNQYDRVEYIKKKLEEVRSEEVQLIDNKDYKTLSSEIILDGLPKGYYVILASNDQDYIHEKSDVIS